MKAVKDFIEEAISIGYKVKTLDGGIYLIDFQNEMQGKQSVRVSVY
jgi:hypothetical protein